MGVIDIDIRLVGSAAKRSCCGRARSTVWRRGPQVCEPEAVNVTSRFSLGTVGDCVRFVSIAPSFAAALHWLFGDNCFFGSKHP